MGKSRFTEIDYVSFDKLSTYKLMWILVMFDLPNETKEQRKAYSMFRKGLKSDGFTMFQLSIYVRNCASKENMQVHINRVKAMLPEEGKICMLRITDRQFQEIEIFEGVKKSKPIPEAIQLEIF